MEREFLEQCLKEGMSLAEIGGLVGRAPGTVGYWVKRHGLQANGAAKFAPRGGLAREQLEPLVAARMTQQEIATELQVGIDTVRRWLQRHGLATIARPDRTLASREARAAGRSRFTSRCDRHGPTDFLALPGGRSKCAACNVEAVTARRRRTKHALAEEAGGACEICGYDRFIGALQFHHRDPRAKRFGISAAGVTRSLDEAREEARKCSLLCANCHAEVEGGLIEIPATLPVCESQSNT